MAKVVINSIKNKAYKIIYIQFLIVVIASLVMLAFENFLSAFACFLGGVVYLVPCFCYARQLFSNLSAHAVKRIIITFYVGEIVKLVVSIGLFIGLYHLFNLPIWPYFLGYLMAALAFCIAPIFVFRPVVEDKAT